MDIHPTLRPTVSVRAAWQHLQELLHGAERLRGTKQAPASRIIGDWQSTETVYAVVEPNEFRHWCEHVEAYLYETFEDAEALVFGFRAFCHFPQFFEFLEGQKFLKSVEAAPCFASIAQQTIQDNCDYGKA
jgi:hypothetical protein